jgi:hypothetical protein
MLPIKRQHQLTVTNRYGSKVRGKVIYMRKIRDGEAAPRGHPHIRTHDWLDPERTPATYSTATQSVEGFYMPHAYEMHEKHGWVFKGIFEQADASIGSTSPVR